MYSFVQSFFSACVAGLVVWYLMRRGSAASGNSASTTAEIEGLRTVVEELTAALEKRAEAAEQRLGKMITEAQAVQGLLDRTLAKVGAQIVRTETPEPASPTTAAAEPASAAPVEPTTVRPAVATEPEVSSPRSVDTSIERTLAGDGSARPAIRSMSADSNAGDLLSPDRQPDAPAPVRSTILSAQAMPVSEPAAPVADLAASPAPARPADVPAAEMPVAATSPSDDFKVAPIMPSTERQPDAPAPVRSTAPASAEVEASTPEPAPASSVAPQAPPTPPAAPVPSKSPTLPGSREPKETAEREARVMSLVACGITNSVEIARQTGLTRGEVELILTLHNLHIAPGREAFAPDHTVVGTSPQTSSEAEQPETAAAVPINPDDRYAAIYALIAAGVTDSVEIARRTGLGRGEVELHMGLHARKVL